MTGRQRRFGSDQSVSDFAAVKERWDGRSEAKPVAQHQYRAHCNRAGCLQYSCGVRRSVSGEVYSRVFNSLHATGGDLETMTVGVVTGLILHPTCIR